MTTTSPAERAALGRAGRRQVPRSTHAAVELGAPARDPVALLEQQAALRVPDLVPVRYGRMLSSAFSFYRGAALVMAHDLAHTPTSGITVQICGDAHLSNFGLFGSPERRLVFDLNDFDETYPGPWEWDVKRLVTSLVVAGRDNGFAPADQRDIARTCAARYRTAMREFATMGNLAVWYAELAADSLDAGFAANLDRTQRKRLTRTLDRARTRDSHQALDKLTAVVDGQRRIVGDPPLIVPITDLLPGVEQAKLTGLLGRLLRGYSGTLPEERRLLFDQFRMVDIAHKVVGVGSVGTRAWIILLLGRDDSDPLFLQAKEAQASVVATQLGGPSFPNEGQRVVQGQRRMQAASDIFLGWHHAPGIDGRHRDYYLRQLRDWKGSAEVDLMTPADLRWYAGMCAWVLARAHARTGDRIAIAAYLGSSDRFDRAVGEFAEAYADQNERDYAALAAAVAAGQVHAMNGT